MILYFSCSNEMRLSKHEWNFLWKMIKQHPRIKKSEWPNRLTSFCDAAFFHSASTFKKYQTQKPWRCRQHEMCFVLSSLSPVFSQATVWNLLKKDGICSHSSRAKGRDFYFNNIASIYVGCQILRSLLMIMKSLPPSAIGRLLCLGW